MSSQTLLFTSSFAVPCRAHFRNALRPSSPAIASPPRFATSFPPRRATMTATSSPKQSPPSTTTTAQPPPSTVSDLDDESTASTRTPLYDTLVVGAGPAGLSLSASLGAQGLRVCCADPNLHRPWPNHYGVWHDEFDSIGLSDCATSHYPVTSIFAGPTDDDKIPLDRAYIRVDRIKLKRRLLDRCLSSGVVFIEQPISAVRHNCAQWSDVTVGGSNDARENGPDSKITSTAAESAEDASPDQTSFSVRARLVIDCTGHALRFMNVDEGSRLYARPWEQAAYGIEAEVESYPFEKNEMVLMDFRDSHMQSGHEAASEAQPTFLYIFPEGPTRAFFEETSVIQEEAVPFEDLKDRLYRRLESSGIIVKRVIEEEFSLIPMGGSLPDRTQRVVGFGGAALLVHPATGYMVGRTVHMARKLAQRVKTELADAGDTGSMDRVAAMCWDEVWGLDMRRQRDFLWFGAELLGTLGMQESRSFFQAFFNLPEDLWSRFLGFQLDNPGVRTMFALRFFFLADLRIRVRLLRAIVEIGGWPLIRSVLPNWVSAAED